ncbi:unnamed protein product [Peniophora sp. CBMAI 1063]|nr:unnamed protein product [Peniophora sp. CBMAI 1063]
MTVKPLLPPSLLPLAKGTRVYHGALSHLPLTPTLANHRLPTRSNVTADAFLRLPCELWQVILFEALRDEPGENLKLITTLASLNYAWALKIRLAPILWGMAFASTTTVAQRYIVASLAQYQSSRNLSIVATGRPKSFRRYLNFAASVTVEEEHARWYHSIRAHGLSLRTFVAKSRTDQWLRLPNAIRLRNFRINGPAQCVPTHLDSLRITNWCADEDLFTFLKICGPSLRELWIDSGCMLRKNGTHDCWQHLLQPLSGSRNLQVLLVLDNDYASLETISAYQPLKFPSIQTIELHSMLIVSDAPELAWVNVTISDSLPFRHMLPCFTGVDRIIVNMRSWYGQPLTHDDTMDGYTHQFPNLRVVEWRCSSNADLAVFLQNDMSPRRLFVHLDIPCTLADAPILNSWLPTRRAVDRALLGPTNTALDGILRQAKARRHKSLTIMMRSSWCEPGAIFVLNDDDHVSGDPSGGFADGISIHASMSGYSSPSSGGIGDVQSPLSVVHALSGVATEHVEAVYMPLDREPEINPYGWESQHPAIEANAELSLTLSDPLHASDARDRAQLCCNIRAMTAVTQLNFDLDEVRRLNGLQLLETLIEDGKLDLRNAKEGVTMPNLRTLIVRYHGEDSLPMDGKIWRQLEDLLSVRGYLAANTRCVPMAHLVVEGNFCHCRTFLRDTILRKRLQSLVDLLTFNAPAGGCSNCTR